MKYYGKLAEGRSWQKVKSECKQQAIELIASDVEEIETNIKKYYETKEILKNEEDGLKAAEENEVRNELRDLASSLNAMKMRELREATGKVQKKRVTSIKSKIKLTKDQRDAMVANSLQLDATIKKLLNI